MGFGEWLSIAAIILVIVLLCFKFGVLRRIHDKAEAEARSEFKKLREINPRIQERHLSNFLLIFSHRNSLIISVMAFSVGTGVALFGFGLVVDNYIEFFEYDLLGDGVKDQIRPITVLFFSSGIVLSIGVITSIIGIWRSSVLWILIRLLEEHMVKEQAGISLPRIISYKGEYLLYAAIIIFIIFVGIVFFLAVITLSNPIENSLDIIYQKGCNIINGTREC